MVINPFIISRITSSMVTLDNLQREQHLLAQRLSEYLLGHGVSEDLRLRIQEFYGRLAHKADVAATFLKKLPLDLIAGVNFEILLPIVQKHGILRMLMVDLTTAAEMTLASEGVETCTLDAGQPLFSVGQEARHMHFIMSGDVSYRSRNCDRSNISGSVVEAIGKGAWLSEQALWLALWRHKGVASACQ